MKIAKYTKNLYASEVYRELERHAVRKGHFDLTPEEQVKLAAQEVNQHTSINTPISAEPTNDLVQDVARLAFAMRRKGLVVQAENLEHKLVIFKQAESLLYNVTDEKNKDFIEMAHSDGDFQVDGFGELGAIETIENIAAKIRAVTEKNPTGKLASLNDIATLIKNAFGEGEDDVENPTTTESTESGAVNVVTQSSVAQIKEQLKQISDGFKQMQSINLDDAMTTFFHGQPGKSSVFNALGGNYQQLDRYGAMYKAAYGQGQPNAQTIESTLISNPNGANQYLQRIGVQDKIAKKLGDLLVKNAMGSGGAVAPSTPTSAPSTSAPYLGMTTAPSDAPYLGMGGETAYTSNDKVKQQAKQISYSVDTQIKKQQQLAQEEVDKVNAKLEPIKVSALKLAGLIEPAVNWKTDNLRDVRNFYIRVNGSIGQMQGELAKIHWILNGFGYADAVQKITQGIDLIKGSLKNLGESIKNVSGANIPDTHGRLLEIKRNLKTVLEKDKENRQAQQTLNLVNKMIRAISENQTKGERAVLDVIQGGYKTWQEFDNDTIQLLELVKRDAGGR